MPLQLYAHPQSPFCRSVSMTLSLVGKDHEYKYLDLFAGEQKSPEFLKINPQHSVPTLVEDDFVLTESRAIAVYVAQKFGTKGQLFPEDLKEQAAVNEKLYFDTNVLWRSFAEVFAPLAFGGQKEINQDKVTALKEKLQLFDGYFEKTGFVAGTKDMTVADICCLATYTTIQATGTVFVNLEDYPKAQKWVETCKNKIPDYEDSNQKGLDIFKKFFHTRTGL
uniref:Glutathione S-transferase delta-epsilon 1 n=1 Tax=Tigriopus japonicus TaxID=158387 RepID=B3VHS0_TIGJA|nr:glutathione S-transferase delta-epsilon 1 [Tigriopus japonicus]